MRPCLVQGEGEGEEITSTASMLLQCLDQRLCYGFEYQGTASLPVMTPRMDNYILAFTQVMVDCVLYSRKYWGELNLVAGPKVTIATVLADLNLGFGMGSP